MTQYRDVITGELGVIRRDRHGAPLFVPHCTGIPRPVEMPDRYRDVISGRPAIRAR